MSSHCSPRIAIANCEQWYIIFCIFSIFLNKLETWTWNFQVFLSQGSELPDHLWKVKLNFCLYSGTHLPKLIRQHFFMASLIFSLTQPTAVNKNWLYFNRLALANSLCYWLKVSTYWRNFSYLWSNGWMYLCIYMPAGAASPYQFSNKCSIYRSNYSCDRKWWQVLQQHVILSSASHDVPIVQIWNLILYGVKK